ncbi:hypothetical protein BY996DRAFT_6417315 [Phakopsora pachyrhizi]|nr:hypothetical protein BY996DRAFT_6417315 [Phakopsora pachyrhizi]
MVHQQLTNSSADKLSISPPNESLQRPKTLSPDRRQAKESVISIAVGGPAALPSRLSGWFQQAFSSSTTNLPMLVGNSIPAAIAAPIGSPDHIKARNTFKAPVARENDDQSSRSSSDPKRSPTTATQPHTGNIRSLGNFFDKAVNYMFDTDAHSYDVRQTGDLWLMGGQRFVGIWKFDEHRDQHVGAEDNSYQYGHSFGGGGSGSDASHPAPHTKKRSALRRATVGKTKGLFKNPHHQSHASSFEALRKSSDPANLNSGVTFSPSPTPSPEPLSNQTSLNRVTNSASSLPSTVTHSYPPLFYHAFVSVIGLTYRCDFPPIPCSSDRLKSTGISGAGARVGGMLASLSLSIGRAGKRSKHASDRSRSPSPNLAFDSNDAENKHPDSVFPRGLTTDVGWGCMLRTGQSLLANSLLVAHLGRDWRRPLASITDQPDSAPTEPIYARLLSWFIDSSSSFAPFSVHRFALKGKELGKEVGEWFGPSTASGAIKALTNNFIPAGIGVVTDVDGTVYRSDVYAASVFPNPYGGQNRRSEGLSATTWERPVLILVNLRLGLDGVNPSYYEAIKATFTFPQSVGIAGGRPSSSYYFCGFQGDSLFYIDPHHSRSAIPLEDPPTPLRVLAQKTVLGSRLSDLTAKTDGDWEQISSNDTDSLLSGSGGSEARSRPRAHTQSSQLHNLSNFSRKSASRPSECSNDDLEEFYVRAYPDSVLRTFHPEKVRRMTLSALDPSMLVGFLVRDSADWEDLTARIRSFKPPLFHIAERTPSWMRSDPDPTSVRRSNDFRPSDDSDLGVDSWSEPDEWTAASRNDETSFAETNDIAGGFDRDETDDDIRDEREEDRQGQERIDLDTHARSIASSSPVDDNGWDDVEGDWKQRPMALKSSVLAPSITPIRSDTVRSKTSVSSSRPDYRMRGQTSHLTNPAAYYRPTMTLPQQSFAQGAEAMKMCEDCDLSNSKEIIRDTREDGLYDDGSVGRSIINAGTVLASVFPTHQLVSSTTFPHSNRDEPRSRNVSAATVRARNSDEHLADNEEALNHGQRRRLDSKGSARALTT